MKLLTLLVVALVSACAPTPAQPTDFNAGLQAVVRLDHSSGFCSGVIYDAPRGMIVTNKHCVERAVTAITVTLRDGRVFIGTVLGVSADVDIAVLQIQATDLTAAKLGDSSKVQLGDWVYAIGHPLGNNWSLTRGIVSYVHRFKPSFGTFIQTDASINPGNSGGGLFNEAMELIGIPSLMSTRNDGGSIGIGYCIGINEAMVIVRTIDKEWK